MHGNVVVAVRVRPLNARELARRTACVVKVDGAQTILAPSVEEDKNGRKAQVKAPKIFTFDHAYDSIDRESEKFSSQSTLFQDLGVELLARAFDGYNCCIFAYGQTGSGKSYTMMGQEDDKGMIPMICEELFRQISSREKEEIRCTVEVSYLEIYSEQVRDLLNPKSKGRLRIREHPVTGPYVEDLSKLIATSYLEIERLMLEGNKARTIASTSMNETSSRSHAVFSIIVTQKRIVAGLNTEKVSKISLVDLAGSERANSTGATGLRLKEGAEINRSLSTLGRVISALAEKVGRPQANVRMNVPYRDSVLTWLLKDSLGGNSLTTMIATISPAAINYEETLSTLRYADSAKKIQNHAVVNEDQNLKMIRELKEELASLKAKMTLADNVVNPEQANQMISITSSDGSVKMVSKAEVVERMEQSAKIMEEINLSWEEKMQNTQRVQREREQALEDLGIQLGKTDTGSGFIGVGTPKRMPHLVNLSEDPLLTELLVYNLKPGRTLCGSADSSESDIKLSGRSILAEHCIFENSCGTVDVRAIQGATVMVNGLRITESKRLRSGYRIIIGDEALHIFRFNNPEEARAERAKHGSGPNTPSKAVRDHTRLLSPDIKGADLEGNCLSEGRSTPMPPTHGNEYSYARREAASTLLNDSNIVDLADEEIDQLFDSLQKVKAGRLRKRASSSRFGHSQNDTEPDHITTEPFVSHPDFETNSSGSSNYEIRTSRRPRAIKTQSTEDSPLRHLAHDDESFLARDRKRASDSERMVQSLNAARLEAESKGEVQQMSVVERLYAARLDAESQLQTQEIDNSFSIQPLHLPKPASTELLYRVLKQWRSLVDVKLSRGILENTVLLKVAQIMTSNIDKSIKLQFSILTGPNLPVSPLETDHVYDHFQSDKMDNDASSRIVIRILDYSRGVVYFSTLENLEAQIKRLSKPLQYEEQHHHQKVKDMLLFGKPFPRYSIVGQASVPLIRPPISEGHIDVDVFSPHTHMQCGILRLDIQISIADTASDHSAIVELEITSLSGFSEKEITDVHVHAFFGQDLGKRLTTKSVSNFGDAAIFFGSRYSCQVFKDELPDIIQFQVFGITKDDFLDRLVSWDDLQESCLCAPQPRTNDLSRELPILCKIQISEIDHAGKYSPCEVFSNNNDDVNYFYLHQGLSRRIHVSWAHQNGQRLTIQSVLNIEISNVRTTNLHDKNTVSVSGSENANLKMLSVGMPVEPHGTLQALNDVVAQWDSSMHNTVSLDRNTPPEKIIILTMNMVLATIQFGNIIVAVELSMRIHGRDQQPSYLSRLFASARISNEITQILLLPSEVPEHMAKPTLSSISHVNDQLAGEAILADWKPRGLSLVQGHRRMMRSQTGSLAIQETRMRYDISKMSQFEAKATTSSSSSSEQVREIVQYLQIRANIHATTDLPAQVIASYPSSVSNLPVSRTMPLSGPIQHSGYLQIHTHVNKWIKSFFVLRRPYFLQYTSSSQHSLLSVINLYWSACTIDDSDNSELGIISFSIKSEDHEWKFRAATSAQRNAWVESIQA